MLTAILVTALLQQAPVVSSAPQVQGTVETLHLGSGKQITAKVVKETESDLFVDLGFDILKVPVAAVVRRQKAAPDQAQKTRVIDEEVFFRTERPEKSVAEGAAEVGEAVVKIETPGGQGSGFITSEEGYIVTNFHVVKGEVEVSVTLYLKSKNGFDLKTVRKVKVIATNASLDLALIKMDPPEGVKLKKVFVGQSEEIKVGDRVYAIGTPIGLERTVSAGIISVTNRTWSGFTHFQITTPINPGNSGGPLFNLRGEVVGVNTSSYIGRQGLNFAIPSKYVMDFLRNRDAFALDRTRSENGVHYLPGPRKPGAKEDKKDKDKKEKAGPDK